MQLLGILVVWVLIALAALTSHPTKREDSAWSLRA
jgi:hypothetical protein